MRKILAFMVLTVLLFTLSIYGEKVATLKELLKPSTQFAVDDTQIYVPENASVLIFSKKDYKLVKKFGSAGEGPQEFKVIPQVPLAVSLSNDKLLVNSFFKVSYFSKKGEFIKALKVQSPGMQFQEFGDNFIGISEIRVNKIIYYVANLYDSNLKKIKEIYKTKHKFQGAGNGLNVVQKIFNVAVFNGNKIILPGEDDATLDILDKDLTKFFSIKIEQEKIKIDQAYKDMAVAYLERIFKNRVQMFKPFKFPEYFPAIANFFIESDTLYISTHEKKNGSTKFITYDMNGKLKKQVFIPIKYQNRIRPFPISIYKDTLYQIFENEETEEWELHLTEIK